MLNKIRRTRRGIHHGGRNCQHQVNVSCAWREASLYGMGNNFAQSARAKIAARTRVAGGIGGSIALGMALPSRGGLFRVLRRVSASPHLAARSMTSIVP